MNLGSHKTVSDAKGTFTSPEKLPDSAEERAQWQFENQNFWEKNSMRYDWRESIPYPEFSKEFYQEIDRRFLSAVHETMPWKKIPFDQWIDFTALKEKDVLEIGTGNGTHAQIISEYAKSYTGIDLTEYATKSTSKRLEHFQLPGKVMQMDAEKLSFPNQSFDFVWSWGVIHHSSNTAAILKEIHRVLRPQGKAVIMVYYRSYWSYYLAGGLLGIFKGYFFRGMNLHQVNQRRTDGALARYYTFLSWRKLVYPFFTISRMETMGNKGDLLPIPGGGIKKSIQNIIPANMTRYLLNQGRMGSFLICELEKK